MSQETALAVFSLLIGAGLLNYLKELIIWMARRRREGSPTGKIITSLEECNRTIALLRSARTDLQNEIDTLRDLLHEERETHAADRLASRQLELELRALICLNPDCRNRIQPGSRRGIVEP